MKDLEFTNNNKTELIYDIIAGFLSIIAVVVVLLKFSTTLSEVQMNIINIIDIIIYLIFLFDYFVRFFTTKNKKSFFKNNIIDFIAILPFEFLSTSAFGSAFKLIRIISYILRLIGDIKEILFTNGFIYALISTVIVTFLGSIGIYVFEYGDSTTIHNYGDALWWSFVTVTTVGYGDISPSTGGGRFIACILMITGIGFLGMLTGTISTFFFAHVNDKKKDKETENKNQLIIDISNLSKDKQNNLINYYEFLKNTN